MKVTDLMVGDWAFISGKAIKLTKGKLAMLLFLDDDSEITPIPLIEEIAANNGFRKQKTHSNGLYIHLTDTLWLAYDNRHNVWYTENVEIYFVHQLQHLLKQCGIEKEIEL